MHTVDSLLKFWLNPLEGNQPKDYLQGAARSQLLLALVKTLDPQPKLILEIGCGPGRNLAVLYDAGYKQLAGIDVNPASIELMIAHYPQMKDTGAVIGRAEDFLPCILDKGYDLVFTMATAQHFPNASVFKEIARVTRQHLITVEDEKHYTPIHFPRNYRTVYEALGFKQLRELDYTQMCELIPELAADPGINERYVARILKCKK